MTTSQFRAGPISSGLALLLALIGAGSMLYYHQALFMPLVAARTAADLDHGYSFGNDFYQVWLTSREWLLHHRDPYSPEMTREIQTGLYGRPLDPSRPRDPVDRRVFPYPAFTDLLLWPVAEFPFAPLRIVAVCVLATLTFASVLLWLHALDWRLSGQWLAVILLLRLCSYPALEALFAAQLGLLVSFLLAASVLALQRHRYLLAGFLMAISTIKPQVTVLAIVYLLIWSFYDWRVRGRFCIGFFSTLALLLAASLAVLPHWIQSWTRTVLAYRHYTQPPLVAQVLTSPLGSRLAGPATVLLTAGAIILALRLAWRNRAVACGSFAFWMTLSLLLALTTVILLPGQAVYDHLILLPGILLLVRYRDELRNAGPAPRTMWVIGGFLLCWPYLAAFALILLRPCMAPELFHSTAVFALPIRTTASLPFAVLALLTWTLRLNPARTQAVAPTPSCV